jgi:hypothetical protein
LAFVLLDVVVDSDFLGADVSFFGADFFLAADFFPVGAAFPVEAFFPVGAAAAARARG